MTRFVARRIKFRNGERHSVLSRVGGLPVHEATLFLAGFRTRGRSANTIHAVCTVLALFHRWLHESDIDLMRRLHEGRFLTGPELYRLAETVQFRAADLPDGKEETGGKAQVINLKRVRMKRSRIEREPVSVSTESQATRLRYIASYLRFLTRYVGSTLSPELSTNLDLEAKRGLSILDSQTPTVSKRARLGAREGMSYEDQGRLLEVVNPNSPDNPWRRDFVRHRNWLIIVLLFATGMRRGELLNLQINDLAQREAKLNIVRRADTNSDRRTLQPTPKTRERTIELHPSIMKAVWEHLAMRRDLRGARKHPYIFVSEDGGELSYKAIDKIFSELRQACPTLGVRLSSHVMRHTWNDRFSEQAEKMQLTEVVEERARNEQQGWTDNSKSASTYTRRYSARKGRELSLELQKKLDETGL